VFSLVSVAEDARFELARVAPNTLSNSADLRSPVSATVAELRKHDPVTAGERWRTGVNETQTETIGLRLESGAGGGGKL